MWDTIDPLIFMSEVTHLTDFAGDKIEWPVYMTIGNLSSKIRQMPSTHSVVMVVLLLIPIKKGNMSQMRLDWQRQTNRVVLNDVLRRLLHLCIFKHNSGGGSEYHNVLFANGTFRRCKWDVAAWLADCQEYSEHHHPELHVCFGCEFPKE